MRLALLQRGRGSARHSALRGLLLAGLLLPGLLLCGCDDDDNGPIIEECLLTLLAPNGGESWAVGDSIAIAWTTSEQCGASVRLDLFHDGDSCAVIADSIADAQGSFDWIAETCAEDSAGYAVRVRDLVTGSADLSDATFVIAPLPVCTLEVTAPNGGEYWVPGAAVTLTWSATEVCGATVTLELLLDGTACRTIATAAPNTSSYDWTVAACGDSTDGYALRVTDDESGAFDESDDTFAITTLIPLEYAIATAGPGEANGYSFTRLVDLDPNVRYIGGATITEDTCIHGHGAWVDLFDAAMGTTENIYVTPEFGSPPPRCDIDHCIITNGGTTEPFGGALEYRPYTYGRVFNNTFFENLIPAIYVHPEVIPGEEGLVVFHNIAAGNGGCGIVVHYTQQDDIRIRYNCLSGHSRGDACSHCACQNEPLEGWSDVNYYNEAVMNITHDPMFINRKLRNLNLHPDSPCVEAGENGEDLGALPYDSGQR